MHLAVVCIGTGLGELVAVDHRAVAAQLLGRVEGLVGAREEGVRRGAVAGEGGEPETHRDGHGPVGEGVLDRRAHPLGDEEGVPLLGLRQDHRELLAARPGDQVDPAAAGPHELAGTHQRRVACRLAEAVVDPVEVVEVAQQDGERAVVSPGALHGGTSAVACRRASCTGRRRRWRPRRPRGRRWGTTAGDARGSRRGARSARPRPTGRLRVCHDREVHARARHGNLESGLLPSEENRHAP
jgi:hypothetical protein